MASAPESTPSWFERHPIWTLGSVLGVGVVLLLFGAEWWLARKTPEDLTILSPGQERYIVLREFSPGMDTIVDMTDEPVYKEGHLGDTDPVIRFRMDDEGFVMPSRVHDDPNVSVVFLGGSTTLCKLVAEDRRFPYLAGRLLEEKTGRTVNAYNSSRSGNDAVFSINKLVNVVVPMHPDVVVMMHNVNDLTQLLYQGSYWKGRARAKVGEFATYEPSPLDRRPGPFSHVGLAFRHLWHRARTGEVQTGDEWQDVRGQRVDVDSTRITAEFRSALVSFVEISRTWGITPVLMTQENRITDVPEAETVFRELQNNLIRKGLDHATYQRLYTRMNEVVREVARNYDVPLIDLDRGIPREAAYMYDLIHFTQAGSERAAALISDALVPIVTAQDSLSAP